MTNLPEKLPTVHDVLTAETLAYGQAEMDFTQLTEWIARHKDLGTYSKGRHEVFVQITDDCEDRNYGFIPCEHCGSCGTKLQKPFNELGQEASRASRSVSDFASYVSQHFTSVAKILAKNKELLVQLLVRFVRKTYREAAKEVDHVVKVWQFWSVNPELAAPLPTTDVCGGAVWITGRHRYPLLEIALQVCKHLAQGKAVILNPEEMYHPLFVCLAELCTEAKLPHDLLNVAYFAPTSLIFCRDTSSLRSILYVEGSDDESEKAKLKTLVSFMDMECFLVYDSGDMNCAIEAIISYIQDNVDEDTGLSACLLVQSSIWEQFLERLKNRMAKLIVGSVHDKNTDLPLCAVESKSDGFLKQLTGFEKNTGIEIVYPGNTEQSSGPRLVIGAQPATQVFTKNIYPIMVAYPFRTHKESLNLANTLSSTLTAACVFTENLSLAIAVAPQINAKIVCVNGYGFLYEGMELNGASISILGKGHVAKPGCAPRALSKDLYTVIDSSKTAQKAWTAMGSLSRAVIFRDFTHMLEQKISSIAAKIGDLGDSEVGAKNGIKLSIENLRFLLKEKQVEGTILSSGAFRGTILQTRQARGLILAVVSEIETPVQTIVGLVSECLLEGNALLLIPVSEQSCVIVSELVACLTACRFPANLVRVLNFDASNVEQNILNLLINGSMDALISLGYTYQIVDINGTVSEKAIPGYINAGNCNFVVSQTFKEQTGYPKYCFIPSGDNFGN